MSAGQRLQTLIAAGVLGVAAVLAWGATTIPSTAGYAGVGPNFLPWVVAVALFVCGALLLREALSGGFRNIDAPSGAARGDWAALAWVSAGVLLNAALITRIGFVFSCALCFVLAVRGLRRSEGNAGPPQVSLLPLGGAGAATRRPWGHLHGPAGDLRRTLVDAATGLAITLPVYWLFVKLLGINLPGATGTGWL